jgi:hypothetical protein
MGVWGGRPSPCGQWRGTLSVGRLLVVIGGLLIGLVMGAPGSALASSGTGQISGTVTDSGGHDLQNICVSANATGHTWGTASTAQNGSYTISPCPPAATPSNSNPARAAATTRLSSTTTSPT